MTTLLRIDASARQSGSHSRQFADRLQTQWQAIHPNASVIYRDLAHQVVPHIGLKTIEGYYTPASQMTKELHAATAMSDQLIDELLSADTLLLSTPMYNFSTPSSLKSWIDQVVRVGKTFSYDPTNGLKGMIKDKDAFIVTASGAPFSSTPIASMDFLVPYLKMLFEFLGFDPVEVIRIEGTTADPETFDEYKRHAVDRISRIFQQPPQLTLSEPM